MQAKCSYTAWREEAQKGRYNNSSYALQKCVHPRDAVEDWQVRATLPFRRRTGVPRWVPFCSSHPHSSALASRPQGPSDLLPWESLFLGSPTASRRCDLSYKLSKHEAVTSCLHWSEDAQPGAGRMGMCAQLWSFMQTPRLNTQTATWVKGIPLLPRWTGQF